MGGGASSLNMEDLIQTTVMVGRAIASLSFPGMYRLVDFHSPKAPRLKSTRHFVLFSDDSEEDDAGQGHSQAGPPLEDYEHMFRVEVNEEFIYLEDVCRVNEQGWQAIHTCCMSYITAPAGLLVVDEMVRLGAPLDQKTKLGPGTFNRGWSSLHMAAAYGVEPLVNRLLAAGADPNCTNSFGYTPMLEACHRGFGSIVNALVGAGARIDYIPSEEASASSPFVAAPAHCALGESARCGFVLIVKALLEAGADKDLRNSLGWTPLHEACFYNRVEVVRTLLTAGASASIRTRSGALPFHLSGLQSIRTLLEEMGGPGSLAQEDDIVDMMAVLHELTMSANMATMSSGHQVQFHFGLEDEGEDEEGEEEDGEYDEEEERMLEAELAELVAEMDHMDRLEQAGGQAKGEGAGEEGDGEAQRAARKTARTRRARQRREAKAQAQQQQQEQELLHSGGLLGDLPSLHKTSPGLSSRAAQDLDQAMQFPDRLEAPRKADEKRKKKRAAAKARGDDVPADMPTEFVCQLSHRPMSDPVKTVYGHVFDRTTLTNWFKQQGHICPLTGAPLAESDLKPQDELAHRIRTWIISKSIRGGEDKEGGGAAGGVEPAPKPESKPESKPDDLYDF